MTTPLATEKDGPARILGRKYPNLVMMYDSETGYEFRVQCEVKFKDKDKATRVKDLMVGKKPTKAELLEIRDIVKDQAKQTAGSSEAFLTIIDIAINDQEPLRDQP